MSSTVSVATESRLWRALFALPILAFAGLMIRAFAMGEPIAPVLQNMLENSQFTWDGGSVKILKEFYGIPPLDEIFAHITVAFAQLQFFSDPRAYWHSLVFLTDFAGIPLVIPLLSQLMGIGVVAPVYFFFFYVFTPAYKLTTPSLHRPGVAPCIALLPTIALAYFSSHFPSYFHPSLEARNWWNWIWQLFPVWGSFTMLAISKTISGLSKTRSTKDDSNQELVILRVTVYLLAFISTATWWYTIPKIEGPVSDVFMPQYFVESPQEPDECLRTIIQYDYICTYSAGFLWLAYHFSDLEKAGICEVPWIRALVVAGIVGAVVGPGSLFILIWLLREELLASQASVREPEKF
ncbi:uncharacterized protein NECHADRAFT_52723 [Fusarium vanettenii 77-13-4]|uniref:Uncharacterized protein n=1 Tax=Fusarium vanettenii (strain ATCC MYA-4622 / CBS 123669 / FGSC 9596 / NRRL 45880 / 77-13-4) TaxID=660122 RepID=C7ZMP0_FUSV7|nr:uncharacterized protein NECHADRAFT_52723 [Fusarium vanettenii 77-13-4]EEU34705.1 hypothetical protein NECHADRAFT_52723 [Fusarium vanettenii 77-13-4]